MAFNLTVFRTRALTAIVFVAVMLLGFLFNAWSFFLLFSIIHFGAWREYQQLIVKIDPDYTISNFHRYGVMIAGWCLMLFFASDDLRIAEVNLSAIGFWLGILFLFILPITELLFAKQLRLKSIVYSALGLLYISLSLALLMDLFDVSFRVRDMAIDFKEMTYSTVGFERPWLLPVIIISCMWVNDTMAYIVGSLIGKTPFSKISPKKTWEGTIGGALLCVLVVGLVLISKWLGQYEPVLLRMPGIHWFIIAAIAAVTGTAGDLLESKLKRMAGVKDSGQLMPGHGGFLDRFDSLLVATPFVWLYVSLFLK